MEARIRLGQRIGRGGMAEVFAAQLVGPAGFEKDVAVKRLLPRFSSDATFLERFLNEARLAARLSHPNIVQIFELGHDGTDHYIVMEAVRGCSLRGLLGRVAEQKGRVPAPVAAYIGAALCAGLAHAHDQHRVIHRDVSPHNVLLSFDGAVKLIDFGIARARSDERLTQVGQVIGKRRYMSPEQMAGEPLDARSDLFPAGIMLYEMLAGVHPFDERSDGNTRVDDAAVADRLRSGDRAPLREVAPDLDAALCDVVERSLEIHRDRRFASARDMGRALGAVKTASATDLEELLRALFGAEADLPWPVDDVRSDGADHTATGNVAGALGAHGASSAQPSVHEITISSDISGNPQGGSVEQIEAITDPSRASPAFARIGVDEQPDVTEPDGALPIDRTRRTLLAATLGIGALATIGAAVGLLRRCGSSALNGETSDAGSLATRDLDAGTRAIAAPDASVAIDDPDANAFDANANAFDANAIAFDEDEIDIDVDDVDAGGGRVIRRPPKKKKGKLTVETRPWTHVRVDGKRVGSTPLAIDVAVGKHRVTLENEASGIRREVDVVISSDEPTVLRLDLRK